MSILRDSKPGLRARAEQLLDASLSAEEELPVEVRSLLYELQVHQVELEMQNEALHEAQVELEQSREKFRDLFELAPIAYLSLNVQGRIKEANRAATELFGVERDELVGERFSTSIASEHAERFEQHKRKVFGAGGRESCELELGFGDQRRVVRLESVRTSGVSPEWRMALVDLTEVRKLELELQQARRLEAIATLVSGVAHDFNNLLMGVLGCSEMALGQIEPDSGAQAPVSAIREAALRGRSVVGQLMTFAQTQNKSRDEEILDLNGVVNATLPMLRQLLGEGIEVRSELHAHNASIRADAGQIQQILLNLASNAQHAMPEGGTFTLETFEPEADPRARGAGGELMPERRVRLRVRDSGCGMDAGTAARAFEPFFTTKPPGVGTGLGLSMVYGSVRKSGGRIDIDSRPGDGTSISIDWPLADNARQRPERPARVSLGPTTRVLVVEDERLVRLTMRHYLEKAGYDVLEAATGEEAIDLLQREKTAPRVLVSDVVLPGIKGPQVQAAAQERWPDIGVVLVSGHAPGLLAQRGFTRPGTPVLQKPFTAEELCTAVNRSLRERASLQ